MGKIPKEVVNACILWVLKQARENGEDGLTDLEIKARVMRMTREQINEARAEDANASS